ncbi:MarR family winged helix-turn-helix transcriptional regulator [Methanosphaera cuniculi]|uniref:MarR family winged helix-turn-helix transcriptional regulator n=1 Tax=Methanosphaera cuniculi TaxID=1077256 RepID=UPI0026EB7F13|nr:MarR family transcriptional regulator [Methanosphaera cuniculi]
MKKEDNVDNIELIAFFSIIDRQHYIYLNHMLKDYNTSAGEFPILMEIYHKGKLTQHELVDTFYLTPGAVARTLRRLEDKNIIHREIDENNRRQNFVTLTSDGADIVKHILNLDIQWEKEVCEFLNENEIHKLKKVLDQILKNSYKIKNKIIEENKK